VGVGFWEGEKNKQSEVAVDLNSRAAQWILLRESIKETGIPGLRRRCSGFSERNGRRGREGGKLGRVCEGIKSGKGDGGKSS